MGSMVAQGTYNVAVVDEIWVEQGLLIEGIDKDDDL